MVASMPLQDGRAVELLLNDELLKLDNEDERDELCELELRLDPVEL